LNRNLIWAEPARLWREATLRAPDQWFSHYALGATLSYTGNCHDAIPAFQRALALDPTVGIVYTDLGLCLMGLGRLDEARPVLEAALRAAPGSPRAHNNLGVLLWRQGDPNAARAHFQEALGLDGSNLVARWNLAATPRDRLRQPGGSAPALSRDASHRAGRRWRRRVHPPKFGASCRGDAVIGVCVRHVNTGPIVKPEERRFVTGALIRETTFTATETALKDFLAALRDRGTRSSPSSSCPVRSARSRTGLASCARSVDVGRDEGLSASRHQGA
jgi:tetratricopeptide (TPR) repeat protein